MKNTILILGGDGYIGWPLAMHVAVNNPDRKVIIIDNEWRRNTSAEMGYRSAIPISSPEERVDAFKATHGLNNLMFLKADAATDKLEEIIYVEKPSVIYHLAQQPSAPYSMKDEEGALHTLVNNETSNMRLLWAVKKHVPDAHIIKLGTFGQYAKADVDIPEGYFTLKHNGRESSRQMPFPREADDVYHISKTNDSNYVSMACRMWGLRVTDVMQSIVFGALTDEMRGNKALYTRLDYDEIFGTVLNRFLAQVITDTPLTIYGTGQQRTGLMALCDVVRSLGKFVVDVPGKGMHRVVNHLTEKSYSINELAVEVKRIAELAGQQVVINRDFDPRNEVEDEKQAYDIATCHVDKNVEKTGLETVVRETLGLLSRYKSGIAKEAFEPRVKWGNYKERKERIVHYEHNDNDITDNRYWEEHRKKYFPSSRINLNAGMLGTISVPVINARHNGALNGLEAFPLGTYVNARQQQEEILHYCAELWPSPGYSVTITHSVTQIMNVLALAILRKLFKTRTGPYKVLTTKHEHYGGVGVFEHLPEFEVHYLDDAELEEPRLSEVIRAIQPDFAFFSHVYYDTFKLSPVDEYGKAIKTMCPNCKIIVDAAQSLGLRALPFGTADVIVASTHKWLFGPHGGGLMWLKSDFVQWLERLYWNGTLDDEESIEGRITISGGQDFQLYSALLESLKLYKQTGKNVIYRRSAYLSYFFREKLADMFTGHGVPYEFLSDPAAPGISMAFSDYDPYPLYNYLNDHNIHIKCIKDHAVNGSRKNIIRVGVPYFETVDRLMFAIQEIDFFLSREN